MVNYGGLGNPIDYTASAFVIRNDKILLVFHKKLKMWLPPGGHIEKDGNGQFTETPDEAAIRETKEETGLEVEIMDASPKTCCDGGKIRFLHVPAFVHIHKIDNKHDHLGFDYICRLKGTVTEGTGDSEHRWFEAGEIDSLITTDELKHRIKTTLEKTRL